MKRILLINCVAVVMYCSAYSQPNYHIVNKIAVVGDGGWDYLTIDDATERLFISHSTMVQVIDVKEKKVIATIPDTKGVHGITLAKDLNKGFISNGKDSSVTIFNLETYTVIEKVYVSGRNPDAILYDPFTHRVFTFNGGGENATVIDAKTNKVIGTIALDGKPEFAVTDNQGKIYVNIEDKSVIKEINSTTLKVTNEWKIAPGVEPSGLAFDSENKILFSVCDNKTMVMMDASNGKVITTLPIGDGVDGAAFDSETKRVYSSNGDGTLTVVQEQDKNTFTVLENIVTQKGARTITLDKKTHHLFLPTAEYGDAPEPTIEKPHPRPTIKPGTFVILEIANDK